MRHIQIASQGPKLLGSAAADLADELRRIRRSKGLTGIETSRLIKNEHGGSLSQSKISKIENLAINPSRKDVELLCTAFEVADSQCQRLLELSEECQIEASTWRTIQRGSTEHPQASILEIEREVDSIQVMQHSILPGLLQTAAYSREVFKRLSTARSDIAAAIETRAERQELLDDTSKRFTFIISEWALNVPLLPSSETQRLQHHKLQAAANRPNCVVRILPLATPIRNIILGSFVIYDRQLVYVESTSHGLVVSDQQSVSEYVDLFEDALGSSISFEEYPSHNLEKQHEKQHTCS